MKRKLTLLLIVIAAAWLLCLPLLALGETARVVTPGGKLNMRKDANEKSNILIDVPNRALVEVEEAGDTWSRIVYKKRTGYVKTSFLKLPSALPGRTVYPDEGTVLLRRSPDADAPLVGAVGCCEQVQIVAVDGEWAQVIWREQTAYAEVLAFSYQLEETDSKAPWISEAGVIASACAMRAAAAQDAAEVAELAAGQTVEVTVIEGDWCLVIAEAGCGYVPVQNVQLQGVEDTGEKAGDLLPADAAQAAAAALKKAYKPFAKEQLYYQITSVPDQNGVAGPLYLCGFYNEQDQYVYVAAVHAGSKAVLFTAAYNGFAAPAKEESLLPSGEVEISLSAQEAKVGDVIDITVQAWTNRQVQYTLKKDGKQIAATQPGTHFAAAFRPREAGEYTLIAAVTDARGDTVEAEAQFTVTGEKGLTALTDMYSQKDGWWSDVKYRHSNMEHSGCAIFALSHALWRMGITDPSTQPETLAKTYAQCLTPNEGTNNERLIRSAAQDFGFRTQKQLIKDQKQIEKLLNDGALFSFRVARGHIAMISGISEDGGMVQVVDSAPSATMERKINVDMYYRMRSGSFRAAQTLDEMPGARWYLDTEDYGALTYWMPITYAAKLGVRLIKPQAQRQSQE